MANGYKIRQTNWAKILDGKVPAKFITDLSDNTYLNFVFILYKHNFDARIIISS